MWDFFLWYWEYRAKQNVVVREIHGGGREAIFGQEFLCERAATVQAEKKMWKEVEGVCLLEQYVRLCMEVGKC